MKHLLLSSFVLCLAGCSSNQQHRPVASPVESVDTATIRPLVLRNEEMATDPMAANPVQMQASLDTFAIATEEGVYLLEPTGYHGDELRQEWEKLPWYGLFKISDTEYEIRATLISIEQTHDDLMDNEGGDTGWRVKVLGKDTLPVMLIGGTISLTPKKTTGKSYEYHILKPDSVLLLDAHYQIQALGNVQPYSEESDEKETVDYGLELIAGTKRQKLLSNYRFIDDGPHVVWQGYLDEDGVPDLLIDCKRDYNERVLVLFLSTKAQEGQLVRPVAKVSSVGC